MMNIVEVPNPTTGHHASPGCSFLPPPSYATGCQCPLCCRHAIRYAATREAQNVSHENAAGARAQRAVRAYTARRGARACHARRARCVQCRMRQRTKGQYPSFVQVNTRAYYI